MRSCSSCRRHIIAGYNAPLETGSAFLGEALPPTSWARHCRQSGKETGCGRQLACARLAQATARRNLAMARQPCRVQGVGPGLAPGRPKRPCAQRRRMMEMGSGAGRVRPWEGGPESRRRPGRGPRDLQCVLPPGSRTRLLLKQRREMQSLLQLGRSKVD